MLPLEQNKKHINMRKKVCIFLFFLGGIWTVKVSAQSFSIKNDSIVHVSGNPNAVHVYAHMTLAPSSTALVEVFLSEYANCSVSVGGGQKSITAPNPLAYVSIMHTFSVTKPGHYYARCTGYDDKGNYNFKTNILHIYIPSLILGTQDLSRPTLSVYPNPATDVLILPETGPYEIITYTGQVVATGICTETKSIPVQTLQNGTYIIVTNGRQRYVFIKK